MLSINAVMVSGSMPQALTRDGCHSLGLELLQDRELGVERQVVWRIDDLVCVAQKGVEGVYAGPDLGGKQSGREIVGPTVSLLYLAAQLVALGERETAVEFLAASRVELQEPPTSRPMRSATSLAPMVTSGTPVPGLVLAPTKYIPCTAFDTIGGRKYPTWKMPCPIPNAAPSSRLYSSRQSSGVLAFS